MGYRVTSADPVVAFDSEALERQIAGRCKTRGPSPVPLTLLGQMRVAIGHAISVADFGARGDGSGLDDSPGFQAAVGAATQAGCALYVPAGIYTCRAPLDMRGASGLCIYGDGVRTRIDVRTGGRELFCCVGASDCTFEDFVVNGPADDPPSAAFLLSRNSGSSASAGLHTFRGVRALGYYTHAAEVSISSEDNKHFACVFENRMDGDGATPARRWAVSVSSDNDTGIVPSYGAAIAGSQVGGNTVHHWTDCSFGYYGATPSFGGCMRISGRQVRIMGCFFTADVKGEAGLKIYSTGGLTLLGGTGEVQGADAGIVVDGTLSNALIEGFSGNSLVCRDGSLVQNSVIRGFFSRTPIAIDLCNVEDSIVSSAITSVQIRGYNHGCILPVAARAGGVYTLPADSQGHTWLEAKQRSDGRTVYRMHEGDSGVVAGLESRKEIGWLRARVHQQWQQDIPAAASITPKARSGAQIFVLLTQNVTAFNVPDDVNPNAGSDPDFDAGLEFAVVFQQDPTGGRTVTLVGYSAAGWSVNLAPNSYTTLRVRLLANGTFLGTF